jgi:hypothetical protein
MPDYEDKGFTPPAPVAMVTLRDRKSGKTISDVPMQIDSGADITLIPQSCIDSLSMSVDPNESYELIGFDGRDGSPRRGFYGFSPMQYTPDCKLRSLFGFSTSAFKLLR